MRRCLVALPLLSMCLSLSACDLLTPKVSSDKLEAELIKWLAEQGLTATEAHCPDNQKLEKGNELECTCHVDGVEIPVHVEVVDPKNGTVKWEPKYTTVTKEQLEQSIRALPDLSGHTLAIDCHKSVFVSLPDAKVDCDLTDLSASEDFVVHLTFTDSAGNYNLQVSAKPS